MQFVKLEDLKKNVIYKENLFKQIEEIIKKPENFNKNNFKRRHLINEKLKSLTILNDFTDTFQKNKLRFKHLKEEYEIFEEKLREAIMLKSKRLNSASMSNRIRQAINIISKDLISQNYIEEVNVEKIIEDLDYNRLFHICVSVCFSCIEHITKEDDNHYKRNLKNSEIVYIKFIYRLQKALYLSFTSIIMNDHEQISEILKEIYDDNNGLVESNTIFYELSNQLADIFTFSLGIYGITREISNRDDQGKYRTLLLISLPDRIFKEFVAAPHLPQIVEPSVTYESIGDHLLYQKRIKNGISSINLSKKTTSALMISQKKKFVINESAIELFNYLDELPYENVKDIDSLPFTPLSIFPQLQNEIESLYNLIDDGKKDSYFRLINDSKLEKKIIPEHYGLTPSDIENIKRLYKLESEYKNRVKLREIHNTIIRFAIIFKKFPIYFINSLDYRGRMYPWNFMFNRSSGIYKYLLLEFSKERIDVKTLNLMKSVFCDSVKIKEFSLNKKDIISKHKKKFFYYILLGLEIDRLMKNKSQMYTNFLLEIDQKSSSSVLLSIILGDLKLSKDSNLFGRSKIDPPTKLMNESKEYFKNFISDISLQVLTTTRNIHKHLNMCMNYNQTSYGRRKKVSNYIENYEDAYNIAYNYEEFTDTIYTNLSKKKKLFNNVIKYYLDNVRDVKKVIVIDTIDGSRVNWTIFEERTKKNYNQKKKYKSPITGEYKSYHSNQLDLKKPKKSKILVGLLPSFIHSIDAAIMRMIILNVYDKSNYIINHLHDSIQFNPKYYDVVMESITDAYVDAEIHKCLKDNLLSNLRNKLLKEERIKFDKLVKELTKADFTEIVVERDKISPESMFPFE